jgi:protein adenylyltransferase
MYNLNDLPFDNSFAALSPSLYTRVQPKGLSNPTLVSANPLVADLLGLNRSELETQDFAKYFSGNALLAGSAPLAMVYSGHQFGSYNPQLGDGRGLLLGEIATEDGNWDLHLKGAGKTPYSRMGDGRAVLRSSIREYLCSEAMAGLGIATTRALCIVGSDDPVYRESAETGAMLLRVARSHIRFGHFEYFHYNQRADIVKQLADYVITRHFPQIAGKDQYFQFLLAVVGKTAELIARWQTVGFAHGVMNTDNMSILGDTFDYGPFGFLDDYNPGFICNHSDDQGRYAFNRQPSIALWNLNALAHSLSSLIETDQIKEALSQYEPQLISRIDELYRAKFGFQATAEDDQQLIADALELLQQDQGDYTLFFLALSRFSTSIATSIATSITEPTATSTTAQSLPLRDRFVNRAGIDQWQQRYQERLLWEQSDDQKRQHAMRRVNPKYVLRNYLAQHAIDEACLSNNYKEVNQLLHVLQSPFEHHSDFEHYAKEPPDWGKKLEVSCSS